MGRDYIIHDGRAHALGTGIDGLSGARASIVEVTRHLARL